MRVSAIDALQRGVLNLRANPMLILLQVAQGLVVAALSLAGLMPLALALGAGALRAIWTLGRRGWDPGRGAELERLVEHALDQWPLLLAALAAAGAVWTVAFLVYCWVQAGILGLLAEGEERAAGLDRPAPADFRVYSWAGFVGAAGARVWKFFWLINLYLLLGLVVLLFVVLAMSLGMATFFDAANPFAALGLGCVVMLLVLAVLLALFAWIGVGKAELVVGDGRVLQTFRRSLAIAWRRAGAVLLLLILFVFASVAIGLAFLPLQLLLDFSLGDSFSRQLGGDLAVMAIQTPISAALALGLASALVALVRGER